MKHLNIAGWLLGTNQARCIGLNDDGLLCELDYRQASVAIILMKTSNQNVFTATQQHPDVHTDLRVCVSQLWRATMHATKSRPSWLNEIRVSVSVSSKEHAVEVLAAHAG